MFSSKGLLEETSFVTQSSHGRAESSFDGGSGHTPIVRF
jgi:hypothetical protein